MIAQKKVSVVIPALNEELAIAKVVKDFLSQKNAAGLPLIDEVVVCDNGSSDDTCVMAAASGAKVVYQAEGGYGIACQTAIRHLEYQDIVLFVDGDDSCLASQAIELLSVLVDKNHVDMVIGSREKGDIEAGALTLPQRFGNLLATSLMALLWGYRASDLGPYRAIHYSSLTSLEMQDRQFGWTIEMQIKAAQQKMKILEVPVNSTRRIGTSKISGTVSGVFGAGKGILGTIFKLRWMQFRKRSCCMPTAAKLQGVS